METELRREELQSDFHTLPSLDDGPLCPCAATDLDNLTVDLSTILGEFWSHPIFLELSIESPRHVFRAYAPMKCFKPFKTLRKGQRVTCFAAQDSNNAGSSSE